MRRKFDVHVDGLDEPMLIVANPNESDLVDMRERLALKSWRKAAFEKGRLPTIGELGVDMITDLEPNLVELEVLPDGDMLYRKYGAAIARAFGRDMTGRRTSELPTPVAKVFLSVYRLAIKRPMPYSTRHRPPADVKVGHWHRLILPMADAKSGKVGEFVVCIVPIS
jgi:hypothetical protein